MHRLRRAAAAVLVVSPLLLGHGGATAGAQLDAIGLLLRDRFAAGRLAGQSEWGPCVVDATALVHQARCAPPPAPGSARHRELVALPASRAPRTAALLDLRWSATTAGAGDRAVEALAEVARRTPGDARVLNDLAVAYLARAEREQQLWPLLHALETIERARATRDSLAPEILFNRALILERLYLVGGARRAWQRYVAVERATAWRREGEEHLAQLARDEDARYWTRGLDALLGQGDAPPRELAAQARRTPQSARETAFALVGAWARATQTGDATRARRALAAAREIGRALDAADGDRGVGRMVRAIDSADATSRAALVRIQRDFVDGVALYGRAAYDSAAPRLDAAWRAWRAAGAPGAGWAAIYLGLATINRGRYDEAEPLLRDVAAGAAPDEPALRGKAVWTLGLSQSRRGATETANRSFRDAMVDVERAGETEGLGMLSSLLMEAYELAGQPGAGRAEALRALHRLAPHRRSGFLANHLGLIAGYARADGLPRAALDLAEEVIEVATPLDRPHVIAWAHAGRARDLLAVGRPDAARAAVADAQRWTGRIAAGRGRDEIRAGVAIVEAQVVRDGDPRAARAALQRAVATYRAGNSKVKLPNALYEAALAAEAAGDAADARRLLGDAVAEIETRRRSFPTVEVRASFYETMERVYDALIVAELDRRRPDAALAYLERARAAAWEPVEPPAGAPRPRRAPLGVDDVRARLAEGEALVEYALLRDRVAIWVVRRAGAAYHEVPVGRDSVAALVDRFDAERGRAEVDATSARAALYDVLLRRVAPALRGARRLTVVPDRELSRVPFVALWDAETRRYVVDGPPVRTLPSAAFAVAAATPARRPTGSVTGAALVVGDPALDAAAASQLGALPGARQEAEAVARIHRGARLLTGDAARRDTLLAYLGGTAIFHFAGHAIANGEQPELSYLALAGPGALLRSREIGELRLSNLRIVVLSACSTLGARATHVGAISGLASSFLRAGAPATLSSLWDVDDGATTPLLVAFHRHLAAGARVEEALRSAQRELLRSGGATPPAPRAWAAFIYTGP